MAAQTVSFGERILRLSHRELQLLEALVRAANAVLSREALLDRVWGLDSLEFEVRTVDVAIARLRRKLAEHMGVNPIETVPGAGYRYRTDTVRVEWVDSPSDTGGGGS
jgi:two-component system response regulator MprA